MTRFELLKKVFQIETKIARKKPFYSNLFVTWKCNSNCFFCNVADNKKKDLSLEEIKHIIDQLSAFGINIVAITGGEPMLRDDIFEIMHYLETKKIIYSIISNGTIWNEEKVQEFRKRKPFNLSFSLDSLNPKTYAQIRGINGLHLLKKTIGLFKEKPLKQGFVNTLSTVTNKNIDEIFDIIEFDRQNNCKFTCGPVMVGSDFEFRTENKDSILNKEKTILLFKKLAKQCKTDKTIIGPSAYYKNISDYFSGNYLVPCDAGEFYISVNASGYVSACQDFPSFGNILETDLKKIMLNRTSDKKVAACAKNTPCFYGCSTFISMIARPRIHKKFEFFLEEFKSGLL